MDIQKSALRRAICGRASVWLHSGNQRDAGHIPDCDYVIRVFPRGRPEYETAGRGDVGYQPRLRARPLHQHPCFGPGPDPGFSFGLRATGSGFRAPLSTGGCRAGRGRRSARRRASADGGHRPVLPHAPVAQEDVRGHDGPAHDGHHGDPGCLALSRRAARTAPSSPGRTCGPPSPPCTGTSPGRLRPPPMWRPPLSVPLSRAIGATPPGAAAWRLAVAPGSAHPGDRGRRRDRADTRHRGRDRGGSPPGSPESLTGVPRSAGHTPLTAAAGSYSTPVAGPSGSGSPTPAGTASVPVRRSTGASAKPRHVAEPVNRHVGRRRGRHFRERGAGGRGHPRAGPAGPPRRAAGPGGGPGTGAG